MPCAATFNELFTEVCSSSEIPNTGPSHDPFSDSQAVPHFPPQLPLLPTHIHLSLDFDIIKRHLKGVARHTVVARSVDADFLVLNAEDFQSVNVSSDEDPDLKFDYDGHLIHICLSKLVGKGASTTITVDYVVEDPIDGLFYSGPFEGTYVVSDHETERARYWLPVVDHPIVRTTLTFDIKTCASADLTVLANGEFVSEKVRGDVKTTSWKMEQPTPSYIVCVAIGRFVRADLGKHDGKPVECFAVEGGRFKYTPEHLKLTFGRTIDMIQYAENKVGLKLPWPKYFQWAVGEVSGAMENSSLVSYDEWYLIDKRSADERCHRVDSTVVHELAHSWFGNLVTCADFAHSFLKESFATLFSAEWYGHRNGNDDFQYTLINYAAGAFSETAYYHRPIVTRRYDWSWSMFDSHLYTNGAWRLHMLRNKLGDKEFWNAITFYLKKRSWTAVETDDFRQDMEEYTGEELVSYFDQWFYSKGHPVLEATYCYNMKDSTVSISLKQTQMSEKKGIGLYDLRVEVAFELGSNEWVTHTMKMENRNATAHLVFKALSKPLQVVIDPEMKVLHSLTKVTGIAHDMQIRMLKKAPTLYGRFQAIRQLHDSKSRRGRMALCGALETESHWGLRTIIASRLGNAMWTDALPSLIEAMEAESDARTVPAIVTAVGNFDEERAEKALLDYVKGEEEHGYGAMSAALRGIGRQRNVEHVDLLESFITDEKKRGGSFEMAQGAAMGLGAIRHWTAAVSLMKLLEGGKDGRFSGRLRATMVRALLHSVVWEGKARRMEVFEFVQKLLRGSGSKRYRLACGSVLVGLSDVGNATGMLDELEATVDNQSQFAVRKMKWNAIQNMDSRESGERNLCLQVEKMQREMRELKTKMEEMQTKLDGRDTAGKEGKTVTDGDKDDENKSRGKKS